MHVTLASDVHSFPLSPFFLLSHMLDHFFSVFQSSPTPEISLDSDGFDSWTSKGVATAPLIDAPDPPHWSLPWLNHSDLKSPWLYVEKTTPDSHTVYTDIGDLKFVSTDGSCPIPQTHPSFVFDRPAGTIHVKLEDISSTVHPKVLWDSNYSLKNTAPGGNGIKIVGYQPETAGGGQLSFAPFCFDGIRSMDQLNTKFRLTVESMKDERDLSIVPFKDVMILRPRPLCDLPLNIRTFIN